MVLTHIAKFERLFRLAASLDIDKEDLRRYTEFINMKIYDLVMRGEAIAKTNGRDLIQPNDVPVTKGLQENIYNFREIDTDVQIVPILDKIVALPPTDLDCNDETRAQLPLIAGGLTVALAHTFKILDADMKNPMTEDWDKAFRIFDQLL